METTILADILLVLHFGYILAVVLPLPLIAAGLFRDWKLIRNSWFRNAHFTAILFLLFQTLMGTTCPLTNWESNLRLGSGQAVYEESFIEHWMGRWIYFDLSSEFFSVLYVLFGSTVVLLYFYCPPNWLEKLNANRFHRKNMDP